MSPNPKMDYFNWSLLPGASPDAFIFDQEELETPHSPDKNTKQVAVSSSVVEPSGIRELNRQQWEDLKPLIQRIYIEENRPFPVLANVLRDEYGFEPT